MGSLVIKMAKSLNAIALQVVYQQVKGAGLLQFHKPIRILLLIRVEHFQLLLVLVELLCLQ